MDAYERLRIAVVKSAVSDLQKALRKSARLGCICGDQVRIEAWFLSDWGQFLCENRGEYIIDRCRRTYKPETPRKEVRKIPEDEQRRICDDYQNGMSYAALLRKYKISRKRIYNILRRWGK